MYALHICGCIYMRLRNAQLHSVQICRQGKANVAFAASPAGCLKKSETND